MTDAQKILDKLLGYSEKNIKSLSELLGYERPQGLYDIKNGKVKRISNELSERITATFPEINKSWILSGEGEMINPASLEMKDKESHYISKRRKLKNSDTSIVKFYDVDFAAGNVEFFEDEQTPTYEMDLPNFKGCIAFRTYGDSMQPLIKSGTIVIAKECKDWMDYIPYGEVFGIVMKDGRKYLKYIKKSSKPETHIALFSENPHYDPFDIPKDKVKSIWLVCGSLNKFIG